MGICFLKDMIVDQPFYAISGLVTFMSIKISYLAYNKSQAFKKILGLAFIIIFFFCLNNFTTWFQKIQSQKKWLHNIYLVLTLRYQLGKQRTHPIIINLDVRPSTKKKKKNLEVRP